MRYLWNNGYRQVFYFGAYMQLWAGPKRYSLQELGLKSSDFNKYIAKVATELQTRGYETYIVGGCLRDLLSEQKIIPKDFDIVTAALPHQVKKCFARSRIIGKRFKIVHVPAGGEIVEVSTFRGRVSWLSLWRGARYQNNIYGNLEQDVWRRDFSANALYYDVKNKEIVDFVGGVDDIKAKKLVMIGNALDRFQEDPVRILRALRFIAKTNFTISEAMTQQIQDKKLLLQQVSKDRLLLEVVKLFSQGHSIRSIQLLQEYGCLQILFTGFSRCAIGLNKFQEFWNAAFRMIDQRYKNKQRLSSSFLFAVLLWPILASQREKLKKHTLYSYKKLVYRVLRFESRHVAIPKKLQDAIKDLWLLQLAFETKTTPFSAEKEKQARFQHAYKFFIIRAKTDEILSEKALMWQSLIGQKDTQNQ